MNKASFLFIVVIILFSCSNNSNVRIESIYDLDTYPQKWQLIKMSGQTPSSESEGADMEWQETLTLNEEGTFIKLRERINVNTEVIGAFFFQELSDGTYLILTHQADNELIGSCTSSSLEEVFWVTSNSGMRRTWNGCDGPGLEYKRIN